MGLNAQTTVPAFTAGQVLTAAQQTNINTGIPVFADSTARDAAFGGTGEKVLAEGQFAFLEDTNTTQFYDGATWTTFGASGLTYITGATFTGVTTVSAAADTFSTTYRNYLILVNFTSIASSGSFRMRLRAGGADVTNSNYFTMQAGINSNGGASNSTANNTSSWNLGDMLNAGATNSSATITLFNPNLGTYTAGTINTQGEDTNVGALGRAGGLNFALTTVVDSVTFFNTVAANMAGTYRIYGYSDL